MHGHWYGIRTERLYRSIAIEVRDRDGEFNVVSSHSIYRYRHIDLSLCSFLLLAIALPIQSFFCFASFLSVFPCVCVIFFAFWVHCVRFFCYFFVPLHRTHTALNTYLSLSLCVWKAIREVALSRSTPCVSHRNFIRFRYSFFVLILDESWCYIDCMWMGLCCFARQNIPSNVFFTVSFYYKFKIMFSFALLLESTKNFYEHSCCCIQNIQFNWYINK